MAITREYLDKIDDLVAEKVMGFTKFNKYGDLGWGIKGKTWYSSYTPSRSLDHAWELVEKYFVQITPQKDHRQNEDFLATINPQYWEFIRGKRFTEEYAKTAPLAISLAVLKYEGIDLPEPC